MKNILLILTAFICLFSLQAKVWEEVPVPYDYEKVYSLFQINDKIYVSRDYNYEYDNGNWVRAEDDTIYDVFGTPYIIRQSNNKVLVSCRNGAFISEDSGENWEKLPTNNKLYLKYADVEITQDNYFMIQFARSPQAEILYSDLYRLNKTTKGWELIQDVRKDTTLNLYVQDISSNSTHLFAAQRKIQTPGMPYDTLEGGLYISSDEGNTWEKTLIDSNIYTVFATDDVLLASTAYGNLFRSEDNGKTWIFERINKVMYSYFLDGERILAYSYPLGIIETRDLGKTWEVLNPVNITSPIYKSKDKYFFMDAGGLVYETDSTFQEIVIINTKATEGNRIINLTYYNDTLFACGTFDSGVQYSTNMGEDWDTYLSSLGSTSVSSIQIKDSVYVCPSSFSSILVSTNYGKTFEKIYVGDYSSILLLNDRIIVYGDSYPAPRYSLDFGKTFVPFDTTTLKKEYVVTKISQVSNGDLIAFTRFGDVYKSSDKAETWTKLADALNTSTTYTSVYNFYEFNGNYYAIDNDDNLIFVSTDKGESWEEIETNKPAYGYGRLRMVDANILFFTYDTKGEYKVSLSTDQGKNWRDVGKELPVSLDSAFSYTYLGTAGNYVFVQLQPWLENDTKVRLYRTTLEKLGITPTKVEAETERNYLYTFPPYPNPAKSEVKVLFYWDINLPMSAEDISIYNLDGKKIATQGNIRLDKQANHYGNIVWDCSTAEPGIYLISIKHGTEARTVKVVVE